MFRQPLMSLYCDWQLREKLQSRIWIHHVEKLNLELRVTFLHRYTTTNAKLVTIIKGYSSELLLMCCGSSCFQGNKNHFLYLDGNYSFADARHFYVNKKGRALLGLVFIRLTEQEIMRNVFAGFETRKNMFYFLHNNCNFVIL